MVDPDLDLRSTGLPNQESTEPGSAALVSPYAFCANHNQRRDTCDLTATFSSSFTRPLQEGVWEAANDLVVGLLLLGPNVKKRSDAGSVVQPSGARVSSMVSSGSTLVPDIVFECD